MFVSVFIVQRCPKDCHPSTTPNLRRVDLTTKWGRGCYKGFSLSVCALVSESGRHVDWCKNDLKDEWQKDTNVHAGRQLRESTYVLTWYEYRYPDIEAAVLGTLIFVVKDKPKSCRTSGTSLSSQFLSSLFTCQQPCPGATSLHPRRLLCCLTHYTITVKTMPFTCVLQPYWPLIWVLAYFSRR